MDLDHGGTIDTEELEQLLKMLGIHSSQEELDSMISEIDPEGGGEISFDAFVAAMSRKTTSQYSADELKAAFRTFAEDAPPGFISVKSLEKALTTYGSEKLNLTEARDLLDQLDTDSSSGLINFVDIVNVMTSS